MTTVGNVVQLQQEDSKAIDRTSAYKERQMWMEIRRALFVAIQAIERRYDMPVTKAGRE